MSKKQKKVLPFKRKTAPATTLHITQHYRMHQLGWISFPVQPEKQVELLRQLEEVTERFKIKGHGMVPAVLTLQNGSQILKEFYVIEANLNELFAAFEAIEKQILGGK